MDAPPLIIDDLDRYGGLRLISWWRQERLAAARVLIVGVGALGNEVLKNLALVGVGTIHVVDFDLIEPSNLARSVFFRAADAGRLKAEVAAERARELNPDVRVLAHCGDVARDVGLGLFAASDVVLGCLDNREARLWVNRQCWKTNTPYVDSGIQEIQGTVQVFRPPDSACYECGMTARDYQLLNLRYSCPQLRPEDLLEGKVPTSPTIASMMAALQVQEALKILHELPCESGVAHVFGGVAVTMYSTRLTRRDECLSHETYPEPTALAVGCDHAAAALFEAARRIWNPSGRMTLVLERDIVTGFDCRVCQTSESLMISRSRLDLSHHLCAGCGTPTVPTVVSAVGEGESLAAAALSTLGVAPFDVARIEAGLETGFFLLESDRDRVLNSPSSPAPPAPLASSSP